MLLALARIIFGAFSQIGQVFPPDEYGSFP
jgi:hypothetical protein